MRKRTLAIKDYIEGIKSADRSILGKALTLVESSLFKDKDLSAELLSELAKQKHKSFRIGLTGIPGVGKSTFIENFGTLLCNQGHKVAVLAVDPSSRFTKGSILGDKTRMENLSRNENAFIRPSPTGTILGGVGSRTRESIQIFEAAGYDRILVETVGVGQSETTVASMVDFFLLLLLPGAGDELQGIKRGIMEMADAIVINKADGEQLSLAQHAAANFSAAIRMYPPKEGDWYCKVLTCSALLNQGLELINETLVEFEKKANDSGAFQQKRIEQSKEWFHSSFQSFIQDWISLEPELAQRFQLAEKEVTNGQVPPSVAAFRLFKELIDKGITFK